MYSGLSSPTERRYKVSSTLLRRFTASSRLPVPGREYPHIIETLREGRFLLPIGARFVRFSVFNKFQHFSKCQQMSTFCGNGRAVARFALHLLTFASILLASPPPSPLFMRVRSAFACRFKAFIWRSDGSRCRLRNLSGAAAKPVKFATVCFQSLFSVSPSCF